MGGMHHSTRRRPSPFARIAALLLGGAGALLIVSDLDLGQHLRPPETPSPTRPAHAPRPAAPKHHAPRPRTTCIDVTSLDHNWDNDMLCTRPDGSQFSTSYAGAERFG